MAPMVDRVGAYRVGGEIHVKEPLGRPRSRWEENIKIDFKMRDAEAWTGLLCLRTGTGGRHLCRR